MQTIAAVAKSILFSKVEHTGSGSSDGNSYQIPPITVALHTAFLLVAGAIAREAHTSDSTHTVHQVKNKSPLLEPIVSTYIQNIPCRTQLISFLLSQKLEEI